MTLVTAKPSIRRKPVYYHGIDRLFDDFFRFDQPLKGSGNTLSAKHPAVNIRETEKDFQLELLVPGWEKSDFQIKVEKSILTVEAVTPKVEASEKPEERTFTYSRREFGRHDFKRSFQIPETVNAEAIDAKYLHGILTLTLPKREEAKAALVRTIEIA